MLPVIDTLRLQLRLNRVNLPLVFKHHALIFTLALRPRHLNFAACIFSNIVTERLSLLFQRFEVFRRYCVALFHNRLAGWLIGDVFLDLLSHELT